MITRFHPLWLLLIACLIACNPQKPESLSARAHISKLPTRDELMSAFRQNRKILIVYASMNKEVVEDYAKLAQQMSIRARNTTFEVKPCSEVTAEDWQNKTIVLLGTRHSNSVLYKVLNQIPFRLKENTIAFDGKEYADAATVAMLSFYPNPLNPKLPVSIITAGNDQTLKSFLEYKMTEGWRLFGWSAWNYEIYQHNKRLLMGMFNAETWAMDKKVHFDFSGEDVPVAETAHFRFLAHQNSSGKSAIQAFANTVETNTEAIQQFVGTASSLPVFTYHLYASAEEKGLMLNNSLQSNVDFDKNEVHTIFNTVYRDNLIGKENELIIRRLLGEPKTKALERGLAIRFTDQWQFKGYAYWASRLFLSDNMLTLSELIDNDLLERESDLVTNCLSASFTDFLIEEWGREVFLEKYADWQPNKMEISKLEKVWHAWLAQKSRGLKPETWSKATLPYLKGFNFAHEGYAIYNGYMSSLATESIEKQADELNCNALAIVPYSFMEEPDKPSFIPVSDSPGGENDQGVIHSAQAAKKQGMSVMLKPQIWMGRGYWPGDVAMNNEADWQQFFDYYHRWMRHYALLAEIWQMDVLCIGTEFAKTTKLRAQDWRALVTKIRGLYSGKLTYAANWGSEFEQFPFWDALDYVGVDCYYPLTENPNADKAELKAGFNKILTKLEKVQKQSGKPLIFTEIGFKSVQTPWLSPHAPSDNSPYFGAHQKLCYEVVLESIHDQPWIGGIFWWKFPSYLEYRGIENDDFNPNRKPAERVVKQWFGRK